MKHSLKEDSRPADLWFWDDWFSSFDVRACNAEARGVWVDMLGVMSKAKVKGTFAINGRQADSKDLAKITGDSIDVVNAALVELERNHVFSRLEDGMIINRRMFDEAELSRIRADAGSKGGAKRWQTDSKNPENVDSKRHSKPQAPLEDEDESDIHSSLKESKNKSYYHLAEFLLERIKVNVPFQKIGENYQEEWADDFRLMIERDKIDVDDVGRILDWATSDAFWKSNIRSASKFREKFGVLEAQSRRVDPRQAEVAKERRVGASPKSDPRESARYAMRAKLGQDRMAEIEAAIASGDDAKVAKIRAEIDQAVNEKIKKED